MRFSLSLSLSVSSSIVRFSLSGLLHAFAFVFLSMGIGFSGLVVRKKLWCWRWWERALHQWQQGVVEIVAVLF